ncbi:MAG: TIR domain-containing protein [Planctomycetes bacterium]|nr:TIR domain-containing protein [Planctomycetota bacterium]
MSEEIPKLFISYSWSTPDHEQWVIKLATELRESGIDVILDKWDLKEGHDAHAFMEKMVADSGIKKVVIVCDRIYAEKANSRSGGVGTETQIISPEVYDKQDQSKFVAILSERDDHGKPYLPIYYKSRIYIDLSDNDLYANNFEQLLRWVYDKPLYIKPEIGKKPVFLSESETTSLGTAPKFRRALDAIRNNKDYAKGALSEYFDTFVEHLERFRIGNEEGEFDDKVVRSIEEFLPFRNEAVEIFLALAQYRNTVETHQLVHRFFELLIPYMYRPEHVSSWKDWDFDNFFYIVHELFIYAIASFLKYECFDAVSYLVRHRYYFEKGSSEDRMISFADIRHYMRSFEHRNNRLQLRRISLRADLLEQRSRTSGLAFLLLMQADFVLFMRDCIDSVRNNTSQSWSPETLLYLERHGGSFEIFARAESKEYFNRIKCLFDISAKTDLEPVLKAFQEEKLRIPRWEWSSFNPAALLGYEQLATRP